MSFCALGPDWTLTQKPSTGGLCDPEIIMMSGLWQCGCCHFILRLRSAQFEQQPWLGVVNDANPTGYFGFGGMALAQCPSIHLIPPPVSYPPTCSSLLQHSLCSASPVFFFSCSSTSFACLCCATPCPSYPSKDRMTHRFECDAPATRQLRWSR